MRRFAADASIPTCHAVTTVRSNANAITATPIRLSPDGGQGNKDMGFNACLLRVINRPDRQVAFELFEGLFDLGQLDVVLPQLSGVFSTEIGAQQVMPVAPTSQAKFCPIQGKGEALGRDRLVFFRLIFPQDEAARTRVCN